MSKEITLIEGILKKKSPKSFLGRPIWQDRYFVLTYSQLCYYKKKEDAGQEAKCLGYLLIENISGAVDLEGQSGGLRFNILLEGADRLFELEAPSRPLVLSWVQAIKKALSTYGKKPTSLAPPPGSTKGGGGKFWKPQEHKKILQVRRAAISAEYLTSGDEADANRNRQKTGTERAIILQALRDCRAFDIMDDQALGEAANAMWEVLVDLNGHVMDEGKTNNTFYVLVDGRLSASTTNPQAALSSPQLSSNPSNDRQSGQFPSFSLGQPAFGGGVPPSPSTNRKGGGGGLESSPSNLGGLINSASYTTPDMRFKGLNQNSNILHLTPGQFFGEGGLLYDVTNTHTILAVEGSKCFAMDRARYKKLIADASQRIYSQRTNFLRSLPLFASSNTDLITQVSEALEVRHIKAGDIIISEGQPGDEFYILEDGRCSATKQDKLICIYQRAGDFFGELALLNNKHRACTITADKDSKILFLSKVDFQVFKPQLKKHFDYRIQQYQSLDGGISSDDDDDDGDIPPPPPPPEDFDAPLNPVYEDEMPPPPPPPPDDGAFFQDADGSDEEDYERTIKLTIADDDSDPEGAPVPPSIALQGYPQANTLQQTQAPAGLPTIGQISHEQRLSALPQNLPLPPTPTNNTYNPESLDTRLELQQQMFGANAELPKHMQRISVLPTDPLAKANKQKLYEFGNGPNHVCTVQNLKDLDIVGTLGRGTFGHVQLVKDKHEHIYALKAVNKAHIVNHHQIPHILHERETMLELDHPFIVKLYRTLRDKNYLYFLLEPSLGGELFTVLRNSEQFDNETARFYAAIVVTVFQYIHAKDILYRDLKPENLLMDADGYIRVTDFGFAKKTKERTYTFCGTPDYLAPEIVASAGHHVGADWWCLGVLIYEMLAGYTPFYDENGPSQMYHKILHGVVDYPPHFTPQAKDIIQNLLQTKPIRRLGVVVGGADLIRSHPWFAGLDWEMLLRRELPGPIQINIKNKYDLTNFDAYPDDDACKDPFTPDPNNPWDEVF